MTHDGSLIATLAMSVVFAFGAGWLASLVRLPPLVGYLLAGIAVGPFTPGYVANGAIAQELAEIGVILLMFGVGLHFSFRDLWAVRGIAVPGAIGQIAIATAIGALIALAWDWPLQSGIVFGLALSVASTVVLLRALEQRNAVKRPEGRIAVGWLVVEDLAMVLALVLLPALADAGKGEEALALGDVLWVLARTITKVAAFVIVVLLVGRRAIPWILERVARSGSGELFTLAVLAPALGIAFLAAEVFQVSFALGAFFAGLVMSESKLSKRAAADSLPLKEAFAVLFFVSVGMLFDPRILVEAPWQILQVVAVIVLGKLLAAILLVSLLGYPLTVALTVGVGLAQIGEFSFILVGIGLSLGILPPEGQSYILSGALLSIALNPLLFRCVPVCEAYIRARPRLLRLIERPGAAMPDMAPPVIQPETASLQGHVLVVGHGRLGASMANELAERGQRFVVIEKDGGLAISLKRGGLPVVVGDAGSASVLAEAGIAGARECIIAVADEKQADRIAETVLAARPDIALTRCESGEKVEAPPVLDGIVEASAG